MYQPKNFILFLPILVLSFFCLFPNQALCAQVSGDLKALSGHKIQIILDIKTPAPNTIIITLHLPADTAVVSAQPAIAKAQPRQGEVNWLLSHVQPGKLRILCRLNKEVKISELIASVRYKNPQTGKMEEDMISGSD